MVAQRQQEWGTFRVTVDGIEGHLARVELPDGSTADWPLTGLPDGTQEGSVILLEIKAGELVKTLDDAETKKRKSQGQSELDALNAKSPEGEIKL